MSSAASDLEQAAREADLVLFTDAYPYGTQETFVGLELPYLLERFPRTLIVPRSYGDARAARDMPDGVAATPPLFPTNARTYRLARGLFSTASIAPFSAARVAQNVFRSPGIIIRWLEAVSTSRAILAHQTTDVLLRHGGHAPWYFYWGAGAAWIIPFLPRSVKTVCRFHGFDVYESRRENRGCMPLQKAILERIRLGACVSEHGRKHLAERYPNQAGALSVHRLGVPEMPQAKPSRDDVLRILTCSRMVPLKRLDALSRALVSLDFPVEWRHLGDGPCRKDIEAVLSRAPPGLVYRFPGQVSNADVRGVYRDEAVDLFVLVSESEGVPVSIMEALGAGVPVLATAVGGVPELVDEHVGQLLPPGAPAAEIAAALREIAEMPEKRQVWARAARRRWRERASAETTFREFVSACAEL